jgi:integrase
MAKRKRLGRSRKGEGSLFSRGRTWWFQIVRDGEKITRSTGKSDLEEARAERDKILAGLSATTRPASSRHESVTVAELIDDYLKWLAADKAKSLYDIEKALNANVRPAFSNRLAASVTSDDLWEYRGTRKAAGRKDATINNELSYLRSAYLHGMKKQTPKKVLETPYFPIVKVENARTGFIELDGYESILGEMCDSLKPLFVLAYHSGCRKRELTNLRWSQVFFKSATRNRGFIQLAPGTTKNDEGRNLPFYGDIEETLTKQKTMRDREFADCPYVLFWHTKDVVENCVRLAPGTEFKDFRKLWARAVKVAGYPGLLLHDLRRSAVRNMVQECGIPEEQAMKISGHKTHEMLKRYNIVSLKGILDSGDKMDDWMKKTRVAQGNTKPESVGGKRTPKVQAGSHHKSDLAHGN